MLDWLTHPLTMYAALGITAGFAWLWTRSLRARLEALEARVAPGADSTAEKLDAILERLEVLNRHAETSASRQSAQPAAEPQPARLPLAAAADPAPAAPAVMESAPPASPERRPAQAANGPSPSSEARQETAADPAVDAAAALRQKRRQVQRLAAMGLAPARIAAALNLPAAEVELLLKIEELLRLRAGAPAPKAESRPEAPAAKAKSV